MLTSNAKTHRPSDFFIALSPRRRKGAKAAAEQNIENNPMHRSHVVAGIGAFGYPENQLTRRANQAYT